MNKNLAIASDHAGYKLKQFLVENLKDLNIKDFGTNDEESCDFPDFASKVCKFVLQDTSFRGLLICGSGVGMSIAANKFKGIRASNVTNEDMAIQSVEHNNVNVLCLGTHNVSKADSLKIVLSFLNSEMSNEEKYHRRINKLED
jgi:ribose 5-phosphate isomerase B